MKKILLATAFIMMVGLFANAQSDGFFRGWNNDNYSNRGGDDPTMPIVPGVDYDNTNDQNTPLGSGLLVLTALGAGYAVYRRRK